MSCLKKIAALLFLCCPAVAGAQIYIGPAFTLYVQPGSSLFMDSLVLKPDRVMGLSDLVVTKDYLPVSTPVGASIRRVYTITAPIVFSGEVGLYYTGSELNGNVPAQLSIGYETAAGSGFVLPANSTSVPGDHYVSLPLHTGTSLARVTAAGPGAPLPVTIRSFDVATLGSEALISWETASEQHCAYFEISRSTDGRQFTTLGTVQAKGDAGQVTAYTVRDSHPQQGVNYYRLMSYDLGNHAAYHGIRQLRFGNGDAARPLFWPNPVSGELHITLDVPPSETATVSVLDLSGKSVQQQHLTGKPATLDMRGLANGGYFLDFRIGPRRYTYKISKQ